MTQIKVTVKHVGKKHKRELRLGPRATIADMLKELGQTRETIVVRRNGKIVVEEERLADGDFIEILPIVTGG
ncbi:MAG: MoaD/ThiS family protein [Candidatus Hadarchaeaceae archaeon]